MTTMHPRPSSAEKRDARAPTTGERHIEQALLHKISLLAEHHARNVQALHRLRSTSSPPTKAWEHDTSPPPPYEAIGSVRTRRICLSKDDSEVNLSRQKFAPANRVFTRVVDTSPRSKKQEPTVVEPFRSMETHAIAWKRKIRKYEESDLQTKKDEEDARARDRKRLIAAINRGREFSGVIARSNEMVERRRKKQVEAKEKEEKERRSREFKARPLHITDEDWQTIKDRQNLRRRQRVQTRKDLISSISHLPRRMAIHALKQEAEAASTARSPGQRDKSSENKVRTKKISIPPEQIRQVLAWRQRRWDQQLAATKRKKKPLVPQVLPMEEREKTYRQRAQERARREHERSSFEETQQLPRREKTFSSSRMPVIPRSTHSFFLKTAQVRARLDKENDNLARQKEKDLARHARQQAMSKTISEVMRRMESQQGRLARRETIAEGRLKAKESQERYRFCLKENKEKLNQATRDAPTLWERHDAEVRKETAKRIALSTIAERVFGAGMVDTQRENWRGPAADKIFDDEERVVLSRIA